MSLAPELRTERLLLRGYRASDLDTCERIWSDPEVMRYLGGQPQSREETWKRLLRNAGLWSLNDLGYWAVEERSTGDLVGTVGLADFQRDIEPPLTEPEAGWVFASHRHRRGYASEALTAMFDWFDASKHAGDSECLVDAGNSVSLRVAEKFGFQQPRKVLYHGVEALVLRRPAPGS